MQAVSIYSQDEKTNLLLVTKARQLEQQGKYKEAAMLYMSLYHASPQNLTYYTGVRRNLLQLKDYDTLAKFIETCKLEQTLLRFEVDDADILFKSGKDKEAIRKWKNLIEGHKIDQNAYNLVATAMIENALFDEAIAIYQKGRLALNDPGLFIFELARLYAYRQEFKKATSEYVQYLLQYLDQIDFIDARLSEIDTQEGAIAEIIEELTGSIATYPGIKSQIHYLLAGLYLRSRDYPTALDHFKMIEGPIKTKSQDAKQGKYLFDFANTAIRDGVYDIGRRAFSLVIENYPNSPYLLRARLGIAQSFETEGRFEEAVQTYKDLQMSFPKAPQSSEALYRIGNIFYSRFYDYDKAIDTFNFMIEKYPGSLYRHKAMFRLGDSWLARGDVNKAMAWYQKPLTENQQINLTTIDEAYYSLGRTRYFQGDFDVALENLNKVGNTTGKSNMPSQGILLNDALALVILITENKNDTEVLKRFATAELYTFQRKFPDALTIFHALVKEKPNSGVSDHALLAIGDLYRLTGDFNAALTAYSRITGDYPDSYLRDLSQQRIGEVMEKDIGDIVKAIKAYEKLLVDYPKSLLLEETRKRIRALETQNKELIP